MRTMTRCCAFAVALAMAVPPPAGAGDHVVTPAEIAARLEATASERARDTLKIQQVIARHFPATAYSVDVQRKVRAGAAALSDLELRELARRAEALETDPVAGVSQKTWIIVGVAVLVLVVLAALIVKSCKEQGAECLNDE